MGDLTNYDAKWKNGCPPDGAPRFWLGESADGRQWLMRWATPKGRWKRGTWFEGEETMPFWAAAGFTANFGSRSVHMEFVKIKGERRAFIVRHMPLPATRQEETDG